MLLIAVLAASCKTNTSSLDACRSIEANTCVSSLGDPLAAKPETASYVASTSACSNFNSANAQTVPIHPSLDDPTPKGILQAGFNQPSQMAPQRLPEPASDPTPAEQPERTRKPASEARQQLQSLAPGGRNTSQPLSIPNDLPGSEAPPIRVVPFNPNDPQANRFAEIEKLYRPLPELDRSVQSEPSQGAAPLTLENLRQMAAQRSPLIRQAMADVQSARGAAIQAGAIPNPHVGFQGDTINTGSTGGYQGGNVSQTIPTGGKLKLAQTAANVDWHNAELALRRACSDLAVQVQANYYAVLVAAERVRVNRALAEFSESVYRVQIVRVKGGEAAPYEPLQLRVLTLQARAQLNQSQNEYAAAWRKLAATLSSPEMPPTKLAGNVGSDLPWIDYRSLQVWMLAHHTNLAIARNSVGKYQRLVQLAKITPWVPDVDVSLAVQHDYTTPPFNTVYSLQGGVPIPVFDRNRGNIVSAEGDLLRASQECDRVRNDLIASLADAYARYQSNRTQVEYNRREILPDQVQAYRAIYERYQQDPDSIQFNDLITAQQTIAAAVSAYIQVLGDQWQSASDLTGLMQVNDLSELERISPPSPEMPESHP